MRSTCRKNHLNTNIPTGLLYVFFNCHSALSTCLTCEILLKIICQSQKVVINIKQALRNTNVLFWCYCVKKHSNCTHNGLKLTLKISLSFDKIFFISIVLFCNMTGNFVVFIPRFPSFQIWQMFIRLTRRIGAKYTGYRCDSNVSNNKVFFYQTSFFTPY